MHAPSLPTPSPAALVISGGGARGMAALGAASVLRRRGILETTRAFVGTSAGALVAASLATRTPPCDAARIFCSPGKRPFRGADTLDAWIRDLVGDATTFEDVLETHGTELVACASSVSTRKPVYFSARTHPTMRVRDALRASCAVPLVFPPVRVLGDAYVDGGLTDNFPMAYARAAYGDALGVRVTALHGKDAYARFLGRFGYDDKSGESGERREGNDDDDKDTMVIRTDRSWLEFVNLTPAAVDELFRTGAAQARAALPPATRGRA